MSGVSPTTAIPSFATQMAEDGVVKMGGAELGQQSAAALLRFADRGSGDHNLVKAFFRLQTGSRK